jgi:hypothetical protein
MFKYGQFFEFLFYHFVFFFILGPFSFIILFPTAGRMLTKNMGFFGVNVMFFNQTIQWALLFSSVFIYFKFDHGVITGTEVMMIATAVFLRICTIASKYGSTHPLRIKLLKSKYLTYEELTQDYMLIQWRDQTDEVIEQELLASIKRHDIDSALFFFSFLAEVDDKVKEKLSGFKTKVAEKTKGFISTQFMAQTGDKEAEAAELAKKGSDQAPEKKLEHMHTDGDQPLMGRLMSQRSNLDDSKMERKDSMAENSDQSVVASGIEVPKNPAPLPP